MKNIRRVVILGKYEYSKYGGTSLCLGLSCGHTKIVARPPSKVPKTAVCHKCSHAKDSPP